MSCEANSDSIKFITDIVNILNNKFYDSARACSEFNNSFMINDDFKRKQLYFDSVGADSGLKMAIEFFDSVCELFGLDYEQKIVDFDYNISFLQKTVRLNYNMICNVTESKTGRIVYKSGQ